MRSITIGLAIAIGLSCAAQPPDRDEMIRQAADSGGGVWSNVNELPDDLTSRDLFTYALALCEADTDLDRLALLFETAAHAIDGFRQIGGSIVHGHDHANERLVHVSALAPGWGRCARLLLAGPEMFRQALGCESQPGTRLERGDGLDGVVLGAAPIG